MNLPYSEPGDPKPIIYLGTSEKPFFTKYGKKALEVNRFWCFSYYYLAVRSDSQSFFQMMKGATSQQGRVFLDSGAFSYLMQARKTGKELSRSEAHKVIGQYVRWILESEFRFDFVATFDYKRDPDVVIEVTRLLEKRGIPSMPIYHGGTSIIALHRLIDLGYRLIGISRGREFHNSGQTRGFLDQVFKITEPAKIKCHGLACTGQEMAIYPWYSVDSSSWSQHAIYGSIFEPDPNSLWRSVPASERQKNSITKVKWDGYSRAFHNLKFWASLDLSKKTKPYQRRSLF